MPSRTVGSGCSIPAGIILALRTCSVLNDFIKKAIISYPQIYTHNKIILSCRAIVTMSQFDCLLYISMGLLTDGKMIGHTKGMSKLSFLISIVTLFVVSATLSLVVFMVRTQYMPQVQSEEPQAVATVTPEPTVTSFIEVEESTVSGGKRVSK